jgi:hypothetical protein
MSFNLSKFKFMASGYLLLNILISIILFNYHSINIIRLIIFFDIIILLIILVYMIGALITEQVSYKGLLYTFLTIISLIIGSNLTFETILKLI